MSQKNINNIVHFLFTLQLLNKLYHWNTMSHARHVATDRFNSKLLELTDKFVEVYIGKYKVKPMIDNISIKNIDDNEIVLLFEEAREFLENIRISDTSLLNIRDELLAEVNQTLYLFTQK
jgi:hypothetical protein